MTGFVTPPGDERGKPTDKSAMPPPVPGAQTDGLVGDDAPRMQAPTAAPAADAPAAPAAEPKKWTKGLLGKAFRMATNMTLGGAFGFAVKAGLVAATGSHVVAIGAGAVLIGTFSTSLQRLWDIRDHNKKNADNKAGYVADFLNFEKTGHSTKHYVRRGLFASTFAAIGGAIGYNLSDWLHSDPGPAPLTVPESEALTPLPIENPVVIDQPPVDMPTVDPVPVQPTPVPEQPLAPIDMPVDTPVVPDHTPVVDQPIDHTPVDPAPVVDPVPDATAPTDPATLPDPSATVDPVVDPVVDPTPMVPTLDDRVADTLDEVRALLPEHPGKELADVLNRLESGNELVRAQALKDMGYYFANGFRGIAEDDTMANRLYELSLEVSGGRNTQALHDLGYQLLYGKGAAVDTVRAHDLLERAAAGGNRLSVPMLQYMDRMGLSPKP